MQNPIVSGGGWPMAFFPPHLPGMPLNFSHSMTNSKPRVGLGVICRCLSQNGTIECLLLKRGPKFVSPLKWSFPGGRLDEDNTDPEDDGERCTIKELEKECGGGTPGGLPPLIHIESYKSGRTLYHVFVIDCEAQTIWQSWNPAVTPKHTGEIDQSAEDLVLQGKKYSATNGFCWTDLHTLIEECMSIGNLDNDKTNTTDLQHGLVRWVKTNGESILKMLMARSPKLERHRHYAPSGNGSLNLQNKGPLGGRPRSGSTGSRTRKIPPENHLFSTPVISNQPIFRPHEHYSGATGNHPPHPMAPHLLGLPLPITPGNIPEFLKHPHGDHGSQLSQAAATGGDHTHIYHPAAIQGGTGVVHVQQQPNLRESTTPTQSSQPQLSPIKTISNIDIEKPVSTAGYPPFEGVNTDTTSGEYTANPYSSELYHTAYPSTSEYDPSIYPSAPPPPPSNTQQPPILQNPQQVTIDSSTSLSGHVPSTHQHTPGHHDQSRYSQSRRTDVCRNFLNGHCMYGEKCWFLHSDQKPHREPLLGPGGILNTALMHQPGMYPGNPAGMGMGGAGDHQFVNQYVSPPKSNGAQINPAGRTGNPIAWQLPGGVTNRMAMFPFIPRGFVGGAQSQMLLRPMMYQNRFGMPQGSDQATPIGVVQDPVLRFRLLSEGMIRDSTDSLVSDISALCVRADHFFVTFLNHFRDYRIMFGLDKPTDNHHIAGEHLFNSNVTCLHHSKVTPTLLVIGTADEGVYMFDTKRNGSANPISPIHEPQQPFDGFITSLVHFTTVAAAQVVVAGTNHGDITWYIAQPPMKAFTVLSHQKAHTPHSVASVQTMGACLISAGSDGTVSLWNMKTPEPLLIDSFQAHTGSLLNVHVLDTSCFLTVGENRAESDIANDMVHSTEKSSPDKVTPETTPTEPLPSQDAPDNPPDQDESMASSFRTMSIASPPSNNTCISQWEYGKPVKNLRTLDNLGSITCSTFYQHTLLGNRFLALGLKAGAVKICNLPSLTIASEIHFQDISDKDCRFIGLNLSRDKEHTYNFNMKNPFRDLILTTVWSDGRIMVCQVDTRRNN